MSVKDRDRTLLRGSARASRCGYLLGTTSAASKLLIRLQRTATWQ